MPFVAAGALAASAVGLYASEDLLWLCVGTYGTDVLPSIAGLDFETGAEVVRHRFPLQADGTTTGLCNEITEDDDGALYVTDSFGARILRVAAADVRTPDRLAVWAQAEPLSGGTSFGANGVTFDGEGAILAVNTNAGTLVRVPINDDGSAGAITPVTLPRALAGPDGLRMEGQLSHIFDGTAPELPFTVVRVPL